MTQIFVGNLAWTTSEHDLRATFERFGHVSSIRLVLNPQTGKPRGFAFVAMPSLDDADEAIARLNGTQLAGRKLVVNEAESRSRAAPARAAAASFWERL